MAYSSFVFNVIIFPGYRGPDGGTVTLLEKTMAGWKEILGWAQDYVSEYNHHNPQNTQRITAIIEKMAAFKAPVDFTPELTPDQIRMLQQKNPELARLPLGGAGSHAAPVPTGHMWLQAPDNTWQLVKDPNYKEPDPDAVKKLKEQASQPVVGDVGAPITNDNPPPLIATPTPGIPPMMKTSDVPLPTGTVLKIQQGPGIVPPTASVPQAGGAGMGGPLGGFANTPVASPEQIAQANKEGAARLGMKE